MRPNAPRPGRDVRPVGGCRLPRDHNYLLILQLLLDVALHAADTDLVARVAPLLAPYAGRAVINSVG